MSSLWRQLRGRKLVEWTLAYLAGAWLLLQFFALIGQTFAWPPVVQRILTVLLAMGLIAAMVFAWYHGERGQQRVTGIELAIFAVLALATGIGVTLVRGDAADLYAAPSSVTPILFQLATSEEAPVSGSAIAVSPDGSMLAYMVPSQGIYLRRLDRVDDHLVSGTELGELPSFSPDGKSLLFKTAPGELRRVPIEGGAAVALPASADFGMSWGDDDNILFAREGALWITSAEGGEPRLVVGPDSSRHHAAYRWPQVLPGSRTALIAWLKEDSSRPGDYELGVVRLSDGEVTELGIAGTNPLYLASGHLVYARGDGTVMAVPFSLRQLRPTGAAVPVLESVGVSLFGSAALSVSRNGTLLYLTAPGSSSKLTLVDRRGVSRPLSAEIRGFAYPRLSPDGRRIAVGVSVSNAAPSDVWTFDIRSHTLSRLTTDGRSVRPDWSPDGSKVLFSGTGSGQVDVRWQPWDGSGPAESYSDGSAEISVSPAGTFVAMRRGALPAGAGDIWLAPADSPRAARPFVASPANEQEPRISPDGTLLAYSSYESGKAEIYVRPIPGPGPRLQVSAAGGVQPVWSRDGKELFYRASGRMMAAELSRSPELVVVRRDSLFTDRYVGAFTGGFTLGHQAFDVTPDGDFIMLEPAADDRVQLLGIANWFEELRRLAK